MAPPSSSRWAAADACTCRTQRCRFCESPFHRLTCTPGLPENCIPLAMPGHIVWESPYQGLSHLNPLPC